MPIKQLCMISWSIFSNARVLIAVLTTIRICAAAGPALDVHHPRLYFTAADLPHLREQKKSGVHEKIWTNLTKSANWCAQQAPRTEWIPTAEKDPQFENLYDRFYAAMHDAAIVEHLAFTSAFSDPEEDHYFVPARKWLLATAKVWKNES